MNQGSLRLRLFLAGLVSIIVALVLSAIVLRATFERHVKRNLVGEMSVVIDTLTAGLDRSADGALAIAAPPRDLRFERPLSGFYWQVAELSGTPILRSRSLWDTELVLPQDIIADGAVHTHEVSGPAGTTLIVIERLVTLPARLGGTRLRVVVGRDAAELAQAARAFNADLVPYLALIGLLLLLAAVAQVAIGLAPLKAVRERLSAVRSGQAARIGDAFPDEVRPLAREVDSFLDQRERDIAVANGRAADLAHGLKTPLQVLAGEAEKQRKDGHAELADALDDVGAAMGRHVERELVRARLAGRRSDATADVLEVVARVVRVLRRTPQGGHLDWKIEIAEGVRAAIHPDDLAESLGAVTENAARFAASTIRVSATVANDEVRIAVMDDGPGIPEDKRAEALRRGGRLDETGAGSGLGLAIAREIIESHHGRLDLGASTPGNMTVTLCLPAGLTDR